jgi:hypothetical protein
MDLILILADEIKKTASESERLQKIEFSLRDSEAINLRRDLINVRIKALAARNEALINTIATTEAASIAGALMQMSIALCRADEQPESDDLRLIVNLLASAVHAIEDSTGISRQQHAGEQFIGELVAALVRSPEVGVRSFAEAAE